MATKTYVANIQSHVLIPAVPVGLFTINVSCSLNIFPSQKIILPPNLVKTDFTTIAIAEPQ